MAQKLSGDLLRKFRDRWQAVAAVEKEEQRAASVSLRWQQLNVLWRLASSMDVAVSDREEDVVRQHWLKLKESQV